MNKPFFALLALLSSAPAQAQGWRVLGDASAIRELPNGLEATVGTGKVRVAAVTPRTIRVRYAADGEFGPETSFAVPSLPNPPRTTLERAADSVTFNTGAVKVRVYKSPLRVAFLEPGPEGKTISEDAPGSPILYNGASFRIWKAMPENEHYFALGDKSGPLDRRGRAFTNWTTDPPLWQESTDLMYHAVPFLLALKDGAAYGVLLDNTFRSSFDLGQERRDAWSFGAEGGEPNYYFFYGPEPKRVLEEFTALTGRMPLPPVWSLGYQQSRGTYLPEARLREVANMLREKRIPADVMYFDGDYQDEHGKTFTVDRKNFPTFESAVRDLARYGFKSVISLDGYVVKSPGQKPWEEGSKGGYFLKNPDGTPYVGEIWLPNTYFPDFTRSDVRRWWGTLYQNFVETGVRGYWNDMNEPSTKPAIPLGTVHTIDGRRAEHREARNVWGHCNDQATYEGLLKLRPDLRPFVLTRSGFAGSHRYAATWTGDNTATWNHLRISVPQLLNLGLSGYAFAGADVGGFNGFSTGPTPELLTRWMQLGAFTPMYRNHCSGLTREREPWVDGEEHEAIRRRFIEARYRLMPYLYTKMEETSRNGTPLMRPMFLEFPKEAAMATNGEQFMFGDALLVAPKVWEIEAPYFATLPAGEWYDYWTGAKLAGGRSVQVDPKIGEMPVFARAGTIVPHQPVVQHAGETPNGPLELRVYPGPGCRGELYADDGDTFAYKRGQFLRTSFACEADEKGVTVRVRAAEGAYKPWYKTLRLVVYGAPSAKSFAADGSEARGGTADSGVFTSPEVPWTGKGREFRLTF